LGLGAGLLERTLRDVYSRTHPTTPRHDEVPMLLLLRTTACALLLLIASLLSAASDPLDPGPIVPSANKARTGTYQVDLGGGYGYYVCVPASYGDGNPAGLHIFFHGQHGQGGAPSFSGWQGPFLDAYNLIGINMQYMDGDNMHDTVGKARAARHALLQTMADYKIVVGRGVISSFSGGGWPHATLANAYSRARGIAWPFCHSAIYSSNYIASAAQGCPMSWFVSVGTQEWSLAGLGQTGTTRTNELYGTLKHGGCPDIHFKITKDKGHTILPEEIAASATEFDRSDLAFAPFVYLPDYPDRVLSGPLRACDALALGPASSMLAKLKAKTGTPADLAAKIDALQSLVDARVARILSVSKQLCADDPVLASYYLPLYLEQIRGLPAEKELRKAMSAAGKDKGFEKTLEANDQFIKIFTTLLHGGSSPIPTPDHIADLRQLVAMMEKGSESGTMAGEILALAQ
jgi:hypothetical protein